MVIGFWITFKSFSWRVDGSDCEAMEELNHETSEPFEGTRNSNSRADFNEDSFGCVDVNLKLSCFVDRRVEQS